VPKYPLADQTLVTEIGLIRAASAAENAERSYGESLLADHGMSLTELAERDGTTMENLSTLKTEERPLPR
jgi:hypothetical protein